MDTSHSMTNTHLSKSESKTKYADDAVHRFVFPSNSATSCNTQHPALHVTERQQKKILWLSSPFTLPPPHHNHFMTLFPGPPGWAGAKRELLDFMMQGKTNRGRHTNHLPGRHSNRTKQCPPPPSPNFFRGRMLFLPPNQQCQSTEGN